MLKRSPRRSDDGKTWNGPLDEVLVGGDTRNPRTKSLALKVALEVRRIRPWLSASNGVRSCQRGLSIQVLARNSIISSPNKRVTRANGIHQVEHSKYIKILYPSPSPTFIWFDLIWLDLILSGNDCQNPLLSGPVPIVPLYLHPCQVLSINGAISVQINTAKQSLQQEAGYAAGVGCFGVLKRQ